MKTLKRVSFKYLMTIRYSLLFLILLVFSCKQVVTTNMALASSEDHSVKLDSFDLKIKSLMTKHSIPGVNVALIENGELNTTRSFGVLQKGSSEQVNNETMFSVGSISKVVNAIMILKLVKDEKLNLDKNVNDYLLQWKIDDNQYTKEKPVTLRGILSHTAGLSVSGFADYLPNESLPNTIQILNGEEPAKNAKVEVVYPVGSKYQYSGGGITVCQKIIEDLTGLPYPEAAQQLLFEPLGLKRTTFENPLPTHYDNIAKAHDEKGNPMALPRGYQSMPEMAASGLWTTPTELAKLVAVIKRNSVNDFTNFLTPELIEEMVTKQYPSDHGLGPEIGNVGGNKIIEHGGSNDSYKAIYCVFWEKDFGYIVFTNGSNGMELIYELLPFIDAYLLNPVK